MGISNAVGLAAAEAHLAAKYNKPGMELIDHYTYCIAGDGCMQEGISHESCSLAGHLKLGKLIAFYDDNGITIDGHTELSFTEDVGKRYEGYGWHVQTVVNGDTDVDAIRKAIAEAKKVTDKPSLIKVKTVIGYGSPNKADSHDAHGAPLGADEAQATRDNLGWPYGEFEVPPGAYETFQKSQSRGAAAEEKWNETWTAYKEAHPDLAAEFQRSVLDRKLPEGWEKCLPVYSPEDKGKATRINSQECLNAISTTCEELIGGSADLAPSNMTLMKNTGDFLPGQYENRNVRYGIREFGMGAMANAMSLDKTGLVPYCATFLIFTDYMRNALRMAALSQAGTIFVMTHDSIAVGEDGPTHQPVETVTSIRAIPGMTVIRPADGNETAGAYKVAMEKSKYESMPTLLALSRQALPNLGGTKEDVALGAYTIVDVDSPDLILIGTGSETHICVEAAKAMSEKVKVVSMPSWELFDEQSAAYQSKILPKDVPKLSVEAGITMGWGKYSDAQVGIDCFGASAPGGTCLEKFGFSVDNVKACAERCMKGERGPISDGTGAR
jgi:transketolase